MSEKLWAHGVEYLVDAGDQQSVAPVSCANVVFLQQRFTA